MSLNPDDQLQRALAFRDLHAAPGAFVMPNVWDAGTASLLTGLGYQALAGTSGGLASSLGRPDGANLVRREETLANARALVGATHLPVSADLEGGFGAGPEHVAETIRLAADAGLVGGSIEDATGDPQAPLYPFAEAVARVRAAVLAARELDFPFTLTARAENFLYGQPDLDDTIRRLQAFEEAGADVLFAPGLPDAESVRAVCAAVSRPVSVLAAGPLLTLTVDQLGELGARRISLGSGLSRVALTATLHAARDIQHTGSFAALTDALPYATVNALLSAPGPDWP
ncbi:isocitrate lyase/phosphoenolpyruvate mutase family protein [Kitasatospora acidiphila]|uniref:Isocitrate lyase/phosphoenolpyruvate mutase family protein n=1 Tax=Kitasatospora acidiphila TaxID=2567942 RepID=A0A540VY53_9ACTN|nr:isocitrate lyase/phosphoenolpyruvate mutase family protein [Kitasatospora acidiphila]TQF01682.1 isocitrate lyase/phosphoenolpyruvate mutase family protein [Kitasatospora acidiphila]